MHNAAVLSLVCFVAGGLLGWGAAQGGASVQRVWPVVLRTQILATSATLYLVATAMGLAPCGVGGGDSDSFAWAAGTDYFAETSVGEFLLGSRPGDLAAGDQTDC